MYKIKNERIAEYGVDAIFTDRWSPRAFSSKTLTSFQIKSLFEAAKWAPSCYNEQPWLFMYASRDIDKKVFLSILDEKNRLWVDPCSLLIFGIVHRNFEKTNKRNKYSMFDLGAAWFSIALQARRMGLFAHAMAGFDSVKAYEVLGVSRKKFNIVVAIAVGFRENSDILNEEFKALEKPNSRKSLKNIIFEGFPYK